VEIPWWTYGAKGMQLWFPSSLSETLSPRSEAVSKSVDPELEFDKEVYPIGISLAEVAIIGEQSVSIPVQNNERLEKEKFMELKVAIFLLKHRASCCCGLQKIRLRHDNCAV
jgi:hypothetical protein